MKYSSIAGKNANLYDHWKSVCRFLTKLEINLLWDPSIALRAYIQRILNHTPRTFVILCSQQRYLLIARTWKQPRSPSTKEWVMKMWYIYTMEYYSEVKNNDFLKFPWKWIELKKHTQYEVTQSQKDELGNYSLITGY